MPLEDDLLFMKAGLQKDTILTHLLPHLFARKILLAYSFTIQVSWRGSHNLTLIATCSSSRRLQTDIQLKYSKLEEEFPSLSSYREKLAVKVALSYSAYIPTIRPSSSIDTTLLHMRKSQIADNIALHY